MRNGTALMANVTLIDKLRNATLSEKEKILSDYIKYEISNMLDVNGNSLDSDTMIWAMDSILLIRLINKFSKILDIQIESSELITIFSQFTIRRFAQLIINKL